MMYLSIANGLGRRKTLIVLGAGASRGASFVGGPYQARPPLDADFFSELQKVDRNKDVKDLLSAAREEFGINLDLSMENFFTRMDYTNRFYDQFNFGRGGYVKRYEKTLETFYQCLPHLFQQVIGEQNCDYHSCIVEHLETYDVILSFNYDCIIDEALRRFAGSKWDPEKKGYGFEISGDTSKWRGETGRGRKAENSIKLLKPHGSLNWKINSHKVELEEHPYEIQTAKNRIVPPTWSKSFSEPYAEVWKEARRQVRQCRAIFVIGYSVPDADFFSHALFKAEVSTRNDPKLDLIVLVNPDRSAREKFVNLIQDGIGPNTQILQLDSLKELSENLSGHKENRDKNDQRNKS